MATLLRPVESHVRVLSHYEAFSVSANHANVKLSNRNTGQSSDTMQVSRVHRGVTTTDLFSEVILPCVSNVFSGQSFTFMVCGPRDSGRSVTLYGNPKVNEKGLLEMVAQELVRAAEVHEATVTHSHFVVQGEDVTECSPSGPAPVGSAVPVFDFGAPLGTLAVPNMTSLTRASDAVVIVPSRSHASSLFTQFHVYTPASRQSGTNRRTLGILTMVDVCAFCAGSAMPKDLVALRDAVRGVAGGMDARVSLTSCRLTQLLENALMGCATLMCISTVTGNPDLYEDTKEALSFADAIGKIQQVLMLLHLNTPKWIFDAAAQSEQLRTMRTHLFANSYAMGCLDFFSSCRKVIASANTASEDIFDHLLDETNSARRRIADEIERQAAILKSEIQQSQSTISIASKEISGVQESVARVANDLHDLDTRARGLEERIECVNQEAEERINSLRTHVYAIKTEDGMRRSEIVQYQHLQDESVDDVEDHELLTRNLIGEFSLRQTEYTLSCQLIERDAKRRRLEETLNAASTAAQTITASHRHDRERLQKQSRLSLLEHQVCRLRSRSASQTGTTSLHSTDVDSLSDANAVPSSSSRHNAEQSNVTSRSLLPTTARHYVDPRHNASSSDASSKENVQQHHHTSSSSDAVKKSPGKANAPATLKRRRDGSENTSIAALYL